MSREVGYTVLEYFYLVYKNSEFSKSQGRRLTADNHDSSFCHHCNIRVGANIAWLVEITTLRLLAEEAIFIIVVYIN